MVIELYKELKESLKYTDEIVSESAVLDFNNYYDFHDAGRELFTVYQNDTLRKRKENELHFHNFLEHQLFSHLQEIKYYSDVDIFDTRRLVAVSQDCISMIQILVRKEIQIIVHFRSSDFDGALPADLEWISTLPNKLLIHLERMKNVKGYEEITEDSLRDLKHKSIKLRLSFGSLHRTING